MDGTKVRSMVEQLRRSGLAKQPGFPAAARAEITAFAARARESGMTYPAIAAAVGVSVNSLLRWRGVEGSRPGLVPVTIVDSVAAASPAQSHPEPARDRREFSVALVSPNGYRLEGLCASAAMNLFRELP